MYAVLNNRTSVVLFVDSAFAACENEVRRLYATYDTLDADENDVSIYDVEQLDEATKAAALAMVKSATVKLDINTFDLTEDTSKPNLAPVWDALDTPVYRVLDEEGVNVAGGQIRRLDHRHWLYVDDTDGYQVMNSSDAERLICVRDEEHVARGYDRNGNVVEL